MTAMAQVTPTLGEFVELAKQGNVIPVFAEFIADGETPVSAFKKLDRGGYSFLFESTEKNDVSGRFSFVGVDPRVVLQSSRTRGSNHRGRKRTATRNKPRSPRGSPKVDGALSVRVASRTAAVCRRRCRFIGYEAIQLSSPKFRWRNKMNFNCPRHCS